MRTLALLVLTAFLTACTSIGGTAYIENPDTPHERYEFSQIHMGVRANIIIYSDDERKAMAAARAAFAEIARLDAIMSDYRVDSELNRLSDSAGHGWVPISKDLFDVLAISHFIAQLTDGAFDVTVGPATQLWREMRNTKTFPPTATLEKTRALVNYTKLHLDEETQSARLETPGMRLDLGGIAKGYAVDRASMILNDLDCSFHLVALAGDIVAGSGPPGKTGWRIAIDPRAVSDTTSIDNP
jgi:thiamine biosynthesis lipoprotein